LGPHSSLDRKYPIFKKNLPVNGFDGAPCQTTPRTTGGNAASTGELDLLETYSRNEGPDALFVVSSGGLQDAVLIGGGHDLGLRVLASLLQEDVVRSEV
jgi:hypothetical protein